MQPDEHSRPIVAAANESLPVDIKRRRTSTFLLLATVGLLVARIPLIFVKFFDRDEFEHSHAAWCVFEGLVPYRDFFEHHTPWYYYALAPFFRWFAVDQSFESARHFLIFGRVLSLVVTALSAVLIFQIGRLLANRTVGLLAALFLVGQPNVVQKTLEIRPDVFALFFFLGALWSLLLGLLKQDDSPRHDLRWFFAGGLCLGAAIMCTQKALFVLPGTFAGLGLWALAGCRRTGFARFYALLIHVAGVVVPGAFTWLGFALVGGGHQFIRNNFLLNAKWRLHSNEHLMVTLETSWPILILCLLGATVALYRFYRSKQGHYAEILLISILGGLIAGILVVPAAYKQYYLPSLALACVFAAIGLHFIVELAKQSAREWLLICGVLLLSIWPVADLAVSFGERDERVMARLRYVFAHTGPADPVLDGWMGTGVFRPHPLYYFFMHGELFVMLSEQDKNAYVEALESGKSRPALITLDDELPALGSRFVRFVMKNYATRDGLFYFPKTKAASP